MMKRVAVVGLLLAVLFIPARVFFTRVAASPVTSPTPTPPSELTTGARDDVEKAIRDAIAAQRDHVLAYLLYEEIIVDIRFSEDGTLAVAWLVSVDPETREGLPSEPGLVLLERRNAGWQVTLPSDQGWAGMVSQAPESLLTSEERSYWLEQYQQSLVNLPAAPLTGYLLPYAAGETRYLSQSVGHDKYTSSGSAHFAFDFYLSGKMWNIYAAKAGTVWKIKYDVPTCYASSCASTQPLGNYIVVKDNTTTPTTYQLYLHLAYDSIPPILRTVGATVVQGQFVGVADNTGQSYGHHLHFQVHTNATSYWGTAVDVVFSDVNINGGRPRVQLYDAPYCRSTDICHDFRSSYVSANVVKGDIVLPTGDLTSPSMADVIRTSTIQLSGWAADSPGSGLYNAQFKAFYNGIWHDLGSPFFASPFSYTWDMCADNVPDGPVSVALRAMDMEGNQNHLAGLRHFTKKYDCSPQPPPPACTPGPDQVSLFTARNFGGACRTYGLGDYANLDSLGDNTAASIRVGANLKATLFTRANFERRGETFTGDDIYLNDNRVTAFTASSMKVMSRSAVPDIPLVTWPAEGQVLTKFDSINLTWMDAGGSVNFKARYTRTTNPVETITSGDLYQPFWNLGTLSPGSYTWQVQAYGGSSWSGWSADRHFSIQDNAPVSPAPAGIPYTDDMENGINGWTASGAGLWHLEDQPDPIDAHSGTHYWWFGSSSNGALQYTTLDPGDLTSRPISLPAGSSSYLRFWYRYQTETTYTHWDQRRVQISVNGGPFTDLLQLYDDPQDIWLLSPDIDLTPYAGTTVRVRFHFHTLDVSYNDYGGWYIDDVSISTAPPPGCADSREPNNMPSAAASIAYGQSIEAGICPGGDVDFYRFSGNAGDRVVIDIDASDAAFHSSQLDAVAYLLDSDGVNALAEHDDEVSGKRKDPHLGFRLPHSGDFYIKVIAWDHPSAGGSDYDYRLRLFTDPVEPSASFTAPASGTYLTGSPFTLQVQAADGDGINRVEFMVHSTEWMNTTWVYLGSDTDGSDGWSFSFDSAGQPEGEEMALYARAYDWAGNWAGALAWNLGIDRNPPGAAMVALPAQQSSTAFKVEWLGSDTISGIDHYDLQWKAGSGSWQNLAAGLPAATTKYWVVGQLGQTYTFRVRAVDRMGNASSYSAEASTSIPGSVCSAPDGFERIQLSPGNDNSPAAASPLQPGSSQVHNFCNPMASSNGLNDEDWLVIQVQAANHYRFLAYPETGSAAAALKLYAADGVTLLAQSSAAGFEHAVSLDWIAPQSGLYFLRVAPLQSGVAGNSVTYRVSARFGYEMFMPVIGR